MKGKRFARVVCLLLICSFVIIAGCQAFSAERNRRRRYSMRTDLDRLVDDVDWILGLQRPSRLYDETRP